MTQAPAVNAHGQPVGPPVPGWVPRQPPGQVVLTGDEVVVRPLTLDDAPALFAATCGPDDAAAWTYMSAGPFPDATALAGYLRPMLDSPDWFPMTILRDGRVAGMACWLRVDRANGSAEVGAIMYGPGLRRTRAGTEVMVLMADHVFGLGYRRYEWKCDALNEPSRRAATRLGFRFEGVFRQAVVYKGRNRDTAWYAITDEDWRRLRPIHQEWLARSADGRTPPSLGERTALGTA